MTKNIDLLLGDRSRPVPTSVKKIKNKIMIKTKFNAIINVISFIDFLLVLISSLALYFLPQGYQGGRNPNYLAETFLGGSRHLWQDIHNWSGWIMLALILVHLLLHTGWIKCLPNIFKKCNTQNNVK